MSKSLFRSTSLVSMMTMVSRVLGFVRDMIATQIFGVNAAVDAFYIAFKIPNFMRNMFAEGSFSQAFVPVLSEYRQTRSHQEVRQFISYIAGSLGLVLLFITILGVMIAPAIVTISAPGLDPLRFELSTEMLRITFPYLMLISLTAFVGAVLNSYGAFGWPSFAPALLNIVLIVTALWFAPYFAIPVVSQAWGVFIAGIVQLLFLLPFLYRLGLFPLPRLNWHDEGVRKVLRLMLPALFGASVSQISLLINTIFASFLKVGSVTWLYYAERLAYFPLGVFGVALATVVLPHLSRKYTDGSKQQFSAALDWGLRCNLLIGLPAALMMWLSAGPIITTLFQYGKFTAYDVAMTQESVIAYAVGLQAFMLAKVLLASFYARQDVKTPLYIGIAAIVFNTIMNLVLIIPMAHSGLALATSLSAWLNVILLYWYLYKRDIYQFQAGWGLFSVRLLFANGVMGVWLYWGADKLEQWLRWSWHERFMHLALLLMVAIGSYFICLGIAGVRLRDFRSSGEVIEQ